MNALAQKTETADVAPDGALSRETLQALHRNFMAGIEKKAREAVSENTANREEMLRAARELLLVAARRHVTIKQKVLSETIDGGIKAIIEMTNKMQSKDFFTKTMRKSIAAASLARKELPEVQKLFGDEERIYLRMKSGTTSETQAKIETYLGRKGYRIVDYRDGYATDGKGKQKFKIGKLLKEHAALLEEYMEDPSRTPASTLVVISRNTEDIARMSAGRSWTSCMDPKDESFRDRGLNDIPSDIRQGSLVAYLVAENDPEINNPLSRVLIKPFIRCDEEERKLKKYTGEDGSGFREDHPLSAAFGRAAIKVKRAVFGHTPVEEARMYVVMDYIYGVVNEDFRKAVTEFVNEKLNTGAEGTFRIAKGLYSDRMSEVLKKKNGKVSETWTWSDGL